MYGARNGCKAVVVQKISGLYFKDGYSKPGVQVKGFLNDREF